MIKRLVSWIRTAPKPTESQIELALAMARHRAALDDEYWRVIWCTGVAVRISKLLSSHELSLLDFSA